MNALIENLPPRIFESFRCFDRRENRLPARWHQHAEIELTFVPKGSGERLIGDHIARYTDSDLVLVGEHLPHTWASDDFRGEPYDMHEAIVLYFKRDFLGREFFEIPEAVKVKDLLNRAKRGLWFPPEVAEKIGAKMQNILVQRGMHRIAELLHCLEMLCEYENTVVLASEGYKCEAKSRNDPKMSLVLQHIVENFTDAELQISQLAELVGMNHSAFARSFRNTTGHTPTRYINRLRVGFARRLLLEQNLSVLNVCYQSGFASVSHFNKLFKSEFSMSPREFREAHLFVHDSSRAVPAHEAKV
ncbi:helix-turn-helix domain-containing protein [Aporhodopirellula aestuarii]|uniref:AraC family transcriptional regulator n=1 Tax=Aporhodopirellula aestuarii TaxID=2950107 RepID=A0ABT0U7Y1_9BACT|nr:AraC family transcriptional regulator [Aporhodopirellula aestuarii]MCM2373020.1 AraC family transcriptional regulator [Aporhodopirellula aestuarii]